MMRPSVVPVVSGVALVLAACAAGCTSSSSGTSGGGDTLRVVATSRDIYSRIPPCATVMPGKPTFRAQVERVRGGRIEPEGRARVKVDGIEPSGASGGVYWDFLSLDAGSSHEVVVSAPRLRDSVARATRRLVSSFWPPSGHIHAAGQDLSCTFAYDTSAPSRWSFELYPPGSDVSAGSWSDSTGAGGSVSIPGATLTTPGCWMVVLVAWYDAPFSNATSDSVLSLRTAFHSEFTVQ